MKAYRVDDDSGEDSAIVFAESPSKAKVFAFFSGDHGFHYGEYIDMRARRLPEIDQYATEHESEFDWCDNAPIFAALGWTCRSNGECDSPSCQLYCTGEF